MITSHPQVPTSNRQLYNHARITLEYHSAPGHEGARIVGFRVEPIRYGSFNMKELFVPCVVNVVGGCLHGCFCVRCRHLPYPCSIEHLVDIVKETDADGNEVEVPHLQTCDPNAGVTPSILRTSHPLYISGLSRPKVQAYWTYDVMWKWSPVRWASRWDIYLSMGDHTASDVHWMSVGTCATIVVFLSVRT